MSSEPNVALDLGEHRLHRLRVGEIGADDERLDTQVAQFGGELLGPRRLVAEVDDDVRAGLREVAHGVGSDAAG